MFFEGLKMTFCRKSRILTVLTLILTMALCAQAADSRTKLKPGWNLFSPQQDVEMGREVARQAERELPILGDRRVNAYVDALGKRLAARAPGEKYPYQFKVVNDGAINAFALPGGYIYINRGIIDAAGSEAQVAGVIAHEIAHVALRHGTNQASKSYVAQAPLAILGGLLGSNSVGGILTQLGISFAASSILLKYSRDAETQADLMGTQLLYDSGYDPKAMVEFFEKIQAESKGRAVQFLSDHPNPENRISNVQKEIQRLGGRPANARNDSPDFRTVKAGLASIPAPRGGTARAANGRTTNGAGRPEAPSGRMVTYRGQDIQFQYPENWRQYGQGNAMTIAPAGGGIINNALAYGMMVATFEADSRGRGLVSLEEARDQLLNDLQRSNPSMRLTRRHERIRVGGQQAYLTEATNESPAGGRETNWVVTALSPEGVPYYFVAVAPQSEFGRYVRTFEDVVESVRFR
jgi:Zn-dependent protease with chaperone function